MRQASPITGEIIRTPLPMLISTARMVPTRLTGTALVHCDVLTVVTFRNVGNYFSTATTRQCDVVSFWARVLLGRQGRQHIKGEEALPHQHAAGDDGDEGDHQLLDGRRHPHAAERRDEEPGAVLDQAGLVEAAGCPVDYDALMA